MVWISFHFINLLLQTRKWKKIFVYEGNFLISYSFFGIIVNVVVLGNRKIDSLKFHSLKGILRFWCQEQDIHFVNCGFFFKFETHEFYCCLGLRFVEKTSRILWGWFWQLQPISFDVREILLSCCWFGGLNKWVNDVYISILNWLRFEDFTSENFVREWNLGFFYKAVCEGTLALIPISWL